jgi:hypothetical protein
MRHLSIIILLLCRLWSNAQEFTIHPNGLIYDEATMGKLGFIVDSLNQKFQACTIGRSFRSVPAARALVLRPEGAYPGLEKALNERISLEELKVRFAMVGDVDTVYAAVLDGTYGADTATSLMTLDLSDGIDEAFELKEPMAEVLARAGNDWFFEHWEYDDKSTWQLLRFLEPPVAKPLPAKYARMVEYVDCLVDTAGQVMLPNEHTPGAARSKDDAMERWVEFVAERTHRPDCERWDKKDRVCKACMKEWERWEMHHFDVLDTMRYDSELIALLTAAYAGTLEGGGSRDLFETYVGRYLGKQQELELKRRRRVLGGCSMDSRPREHALSIAMLAAETISWPIFLRAHLDIMNDRFERVSDGSYAWGQRNTYLRELEELHIDVPGLVLGSCLRVSDASDGHYFGSVGRVGRALAETHEPDAVEERMFGMITDPELDVFNRTVIWYLYLNYCHNLADKDHAQAQQEQVMAAAMAFPGPLARTASK